MKSPFRYRFGYCDCVETGIGEGIMMTLLRLNFPNRNFVKECPHWEHGELEV